MMISPPKKITKKQQRQQSAQSAKLKRRLSTVQTCTLLALAFCSIIMMIQFYLHSQLHEQNVHAHNDDDDNVLDDFIDDDLNLMLKKGSGISNSKSKSDTNSNVKSAPAHMKINANNVKVNKVKRNSVRSKSSNDKDKGIDCGCPETCTHEVLLKGNSNFSCETRIRKLMSKYNFNEKDACEMSSLSSPTSSDASNNASNDNNEKGLKPCPVQCHPTQCHLLEVQQQPPIKKNIDCGCPKSCDERSLHKRNKQFLCLDRINHLINKKNMNEIDACKSASQTTFNLMNDADLLLSNINKPCEYECHPDLCTNMTSRPVLLDVTNINLPKGGVVEQQGNVLGGVVVVPESAPLASDTLVSDTSKKEPPGTTFTKYENAVIVTKVQSPNSIKQLIQMLCLLNAAYNRFVHHDIIIFTTEPFSTEQMQEVSDIVSPYTKLQIVTEGKSLQEHINEMNSTEVEHLYKRCNVKENEMITWSHHCQEENTPHMFNLGYAWQAEFRSYHLWTHDALKKYKYMMWIDADAMCTKTWDYDPFKVMIENDLILMYDQFPGGYVRGEVLKQKMKDGYNIQNNKDIICDVTLDEEKGILKPEFCKHENSIPSIKQIYGFHHITNLDVYRQENHQKFLKELVTNDYKFSRLWDDQLAVTLPAIMEDPSRCWDYRIHGLHMGIHHNGRIDGKEHARYTSYLNYWPNVGKYTWPAARAMCDGLVTEIS